MAKSIKRLSLVAVVAAAAGYVAGLLTAPKSGKETRDDLKHAGQKSREEIERALKNASMELADLLDEAKRRGSAMNGKARNELDSLIESARAAREKARTLLSALHEGTSTDEDLRIAAAQTTSALKHLRAYLKR